MPTVSTIEMEAPLAVDVRVTDDTLSVDLRDGRTLSIPLAWYPRLVYGSERERGNWRLIGAGEGVHWSELDEDVSVLGLLEGRPSGEGSASFERWLASRMG
jgi:hypothetical protein